MPDHRRLTIPAINPLVAMLQGAWKPCPLPAAPPTFILFPTSIQSVRSARVFQPLEPPRRRAARSSLLALLGFTGLALLVGVSNGTVTAHGVQGWYPVLAMPPGTPPTWLLAPVWAASYVLLGTAAWLVWRRVDIGVERKRAALRLWGWGLLADAAWSPAFFGLHWLGCSLGVVLTMLAVALLVARRFQPLQPAGAMLMAACAAWIAYAAYLSAGAWWLSLG